MSRPTFAARTIYYTLPACPGCRGHDLETVRSIRDESGTIQSKRCRECGERFTAVGEYSAEHFQDVEVTKNGRPTMGHHE